jgi:hypothetical protein
VSLVGSLERRVELLEERRALEAVGVILERARAASLDDAARFLLAKELAGPNATFEEAEEEAWRCIDVTPEMVQTVSRRDGLGEQLGTQLGALLARRPGLHELMRERYPEATSRRFSWMLDEK